MNYLDYREALGIGFNDEEKTQLFINRIQVFFHWNHIYFDYQDEERFCYAVGLPVSQDNRFYTGSSAGIQRVWLYLEKKKNCFYDFLATLVTFANTYEGTLKDIEIIIESIKEALDDSRIPYEIKKDKDGIFFYIYIHSNIFYL